MRSIEIVYRCEASNTARHEQPADPHAARARLNAGNRDFADLLNTLDGGTGAARRVVHVDPHDFGLLAHTPGDLRQHPFAAILSCSDARVPVELVFNDGPNDLFVIRVAGNGLGDEVLGSLRYAVDNLHSMRLIVVLGHSGCGAVTAAVDVFLSPRGYLSLVTTHALRGVIDKLLLIVHQSAMQLERVHGRDVTARPGYRNALIEMSVAGNAALSAHTIAREVARPTLAAAWGVYPLLRHRIWAATPDSYDWGGLAMAPTDQDGFDALGVTLAASERVATLLG